MRAALLPTIAFLCSLGLALFALLLPVYAFVPNLIERALHIGLAIPLIFLTSRKAAGRAALLLDVGLTALGLFLCGYLIVNFQAVLDQYGVVTGSGQTILGLLMVLVVLEAARRMIRPVLPTITLLFLLYALYGHHIPGYFGHVKYDLAQIVGLLYLTTGGIWGQLTGISANIIAIFVFMGAFVGATGGGAGFRLLSIRTAGRLRGGPAKVATVASAMFGTISGSASANVVTTGAFTIPMMKKLGFRPPFAAAVEAVASTGGQIMPPIMGAGAFIMAELIQTPYLKIAVAAFFPAVLYYFTCWVGIHFFAMRDGLRGLDAAELPSWRETWRASAFFILPFGVLLTFLVLAYTPQYAAFWATLSTLPLALLTTDLRFDRTALHKLTGAIRDGGPQVAMIASICACAQMIIAILSHTGLGVKISTSILQMSRGSLFLTLLLTMITCIILGMEVPTTAAYIMAVIVAAPALIQLGVHPLAAHLFVFYFAILSAITPPVCGAVYIAAGMAGADWMETARYSLRLSYAAFLLPFVFVYDYSILLVVQGGPLAILAAIVRTTAAMVALSAGFIGQLRGPLTWAGRLALIVVGILWIVPHWAWDLLALIGSAFVFLDRRWLYRRSQRDAAS
ncbi:MAG TPA: TRAP transporter fused permease subunit [Candidatus Methylomirabilis sp.]|nr:TRAP transporter fused permease subunit [Candidatus Methylomirabilis sp.]